MTPHPEQGVKERWTVRVCGECGAQLASNETHGRGYGGNHVGGVPFAFVPAVPVDEAAVERAARALYEEGHGYDIDADPVARESMLSVARAALSAAGRTPEEGA